LPGEGKGEGEGGGEGECEGEGKGKGMGEGEDEGMAEGKGEGVRRGRGGGDMGVVGSPTCCPHLAPPSSEARIAWLSSRNVPRPSPPRAPRFTPVYGIPHQDFFRPEIMHDDYSFVGGSFDSGGLYCSAVADTPSPHYSYLREIDRLPMTARPEVFGMHSNANIVCEQNATFELFDTLVSLQVRCPATLNCVPRALRGVARRGVWGSGEGEGGTRCRHDCRTHAILGGAVSRVRSQACGGGLWLCGSAGGVFLQPRFAVDAGKSRERLIQDAAELILSRLPDEFDMAAVSKKFEIQCVVYLFVG
jgi:hypothetical protein